MVVLQDFSHLNEPKRGLAMTNKSQINMRSERLPTAGLNKMLHYRHQKLKPEILTICNINFH